ncbi:hypothetical protein [Campylobacter porcelli]|uniref:Uncharacterized protein n=1 Tax=Campylobacter porcelli TaxID=1660073 RepID=A0A1X9SUS9_9BACT|nr:hypothetical protein [Campylobacter sp. RM6137]ARQ99970.1 hypothetical protein CSUIS_0114 [Campylobacter sp. RM6137]
MALVDVCGKLIDTTLKFVGKPALDFAQIELEKQIARQKEEQKKLLSIEYTKEELSINATNSNTDTSSTDTQSTQTSQSAVDSSSFDGIDISYSRTYLKLDIYV